MPFALKNAKVTFHREMDVLLATVKCQYALVYLEDIIVFSELAQEHLRYNEEVLQLLKNASVTVKFKNCHFFSASIFSLGHVIAPGKLQEARKGTEAIAALR